MKIFERRTVDASGSVDNITAETVAAVTHGPADRAAGIRFGRFVLLSQLVETTTRHSIDIDGGSGESVNYWPLALALTDSSVGKR